ncbi:hypothetical protein B1R94_10475 [Mycolicibacterium litorale]|nr:hypothetical protein B1R94_10475 [Mycolicibacterium litorale]
MTDPTRPALGLSVGATMLAAVTLDRSITRKPVITLFRHRPPEVGVPAENAALGEPGLVITDFVDRVGDPVGIVAADGSVHHAETLLADALRALAYAATAGRPLPPAALSYPAHWRSAAVEALRRALHRIPEWSVAEPALIPDTAAASSALRADPGLPTRGVVALCDFGGSGTSITLLDGDRHIAATVRHLDFSGDLVDQALLAHVVAELSAGGTLDVTGTSAIGNLSRLRAECRAAKERLSTTTVTALPADLPGFRGDVRLTRIELDDTLRRPLADVVATLEDTLTRAGVRPAELAAVATIGGGAAIPMITTTLSEHLRVPVITTARPALTGAIGAALRAARGPADDAATALAPAPAVPVAPVVPPAPAAPTGQALAWSQEDDIPDLAPAAELPAVASPRPDLDFEPEPAPPERNDQAWYRRPMPVVAAALLVIAVAGAGTAVALRADNSAAPATPTPSITTTPQAAPAPPAPAAEPTSVTVQNQAVQDTPAPAPRTVVQVPAPVTQTQVVQAPPVTTEAPPPPPVTETQTTTVVSTEVSTPPPVTETATVAPSATPPPPFIPTIPPIPTIPGLPQFLQPHSG